jgi:hypothetical protein
MAKFAAPSNITWRWPKQDIEHFTKEKKMQCCSLRGRSNNKALKINPVICFIHHILSEWIHGQKSSRYFQKMLCYFYNLVMVICCQDDCRLGALRNAGKNINQPTLWPIYLTSLWNTKHWYEAQHINLMISMIRIVKFILHDVKIYHKFIMVLSCSKLYYSYWKLSHCTYQ